MKKVMIATGNKGKVREFEKLLGQLGFEVLSLADFPDVGEIVEDGITFEENALIKARTLHKILGVPVLADDSGLIVDALDGRPGVYSARYAGEPKSDLRNLNKILDEMKHVPDGKRSARFFCVIAYVDDDFHLTAEGSVEGEILHEAVGENGFGYDPIFFANEKGKSMALLHDDEKNEISHRARALKELMKKLRKVGIEYENTNCK